MLGIGLPSRLASESTASIHQKLTSAEQTFSLQKRRGVFPDLTTASEPLNAVGVTYGFIEEAPRIVHMTPQDVVDWISKMGDVPAELKEMHPRINILECVLLKDLGLVLATKRYGRVRFETVHRAVETVRNAISSNPDGITEYGRSENPKDTWLRHGIRFLDHLVNNFKREQLQVLKMAHKKNTRTIVFEDVTDLIRDSGLAKASETLGLGRQNTVEVKIDWYQNLLTRFEMIMRFDYRRGIGFRTNLMEYNTFNERAMILRRFADEYQKALGRPWSELLYGESIPYYFPGVAETSPQIQGC